MELSTSGVKNIEKSPTPLTSVEMVGRVEPFHLRVFHLDSLTHSFTLEKLAESLFA